MLPVPPSTESRPERYRTRFELVPTLEHLRAPVDS
jgi:hypothetical protein